MPQAKKAPKVTVVKPQTKKADKPKVAAIKVDMTAKYVSTGAYNPKAAVNVSSLEVVEGVLPATYKEIQAAIPKHMDFVGYLIRRGGIAPQ